MNLFLQFKDYKNWKWGNVGRTKTNDAYRLESLIDVPGLSKNRNLTLCYDATR